MKQDKIISKSMENYAKSEQCCLCVLQYFWISLDFREIDVLKLGPCIGERTLALYIAHPVLILGTAYGPKHCQGDQPSIALKQKKILGSKGPNTFIAFL